LPDTFHKSCALALNATQINRTAPMNDFIILYH
jgi:hypothetical protein